ncbi:MAG: alpha/beta hydrolase [Rhodospirillales bacterium]
MSGSIKRGFCDVSDGQIHYRTAGPLGAGGSNSTGTESGTPLVLIHASPGSAKSLEPLMLALSGSRTVIAPDTMGNGDSTGTMPAQPEIAYFAELVLEAIAALGIERFDLYGTHTGGSIAAEIAIQAPSRVRKLVIDGIGLYSDELQAELLERYAPAMQPDLHGAHITWAWHFVRDTYMFWPWYATDAAHRRSIGLPPPEMLHDKVMDVLKAITTYHLSYRAAFRYDKRQRFALIRVPTMAACAASDMLAQFHDEFAALIPGAVKAVIPAVTADPVGAAAAIGRFLDG